MNFFCFLKEAALWLFAALGAIGGAIWLWGKLENLFFRICAELSLKKQKDDFYYQRIEIGAVLSNNGKSWHTLRRAKIISTVHGLDKVRLGFLLKNEIKHCYRVTPVGFNPVEITDVSSFEFRQMAVMLPKVLNKGESAEFDFICDWEKVQQDEDILAFRISTRVDAVRLRVVLPHVDANAVSLRILDIRNVVLQEKKLHADALTHEVSFETKFPKIGLTYAIIWKNSKTMEND